MESKKERVNITWIWCEHRKWMQFWLLTDAEISNQTVFFTLVFMIFKRKNQT